MSTLLLRFGGPLQSWGSDSKYDERNTDNMPTKSAVIGMIASALGRSRDESNRDLVENLRFGVRIDQKGVIINDFQITNMGPFLNANLSNKKHLSDALFLVGLEGPQELLKEIERAVTHPKYPLFLGRRSCPPDRPVNRGIREESLYKALYDEEWLVAEWRRNKSDPVLRIIIDSESEKGARKRDVPLSFSPFKRDYSFRYEEEMPPRVMNVDSAEHDAFSELR